MRRAGFWILLIAFCAAVIWWILSVPHAPERLYAAVPAQAVYISVHRDIAGRWDAFLTNPLTRSLLVSFGLDVDELEVAKDDPVFRQWLQRLCSAETVLAYMPHFRGARSDVWVFTSWLGGRSQRLRWMMGWADASGFRKVGRYGGREIWRLDEKQTTLPYPVYFAFVEGGVVGCMSSYASAIQYVMDVYDGRVQAQDRPFTNWLAHVTAEPRRLDSGWVRPRTRRRVPNLTYGINRLETNAVDGCIGVDAGNLPALSDVQDMDLQTLQRMLGPLPIAVAVAALEQPQEPWLGMVGGAHATALRKAVAEVQPSIISMALLSGDYSGRFKGLRIPAVLAGVQVVDTEQALQQIQVILDVLNAAYRWGLIAGAHPVGARRMYVIESTSHTPYTLFSFQERLAYAAVGRWIFLSSNAGSLARLLERYDAQPHLAEDMPAAPWMKGLADKNVPGCGWVDLKRGSKVMRNAIAAWSLKMLFEDAAGSQEVRRHLNRTRAWLEALAAMETVWLRLEAEPGVRRICLEMGPHAVLPAGSGNKK